MAGHPESRVSDAGNSLPSRAPSDPSRMWGRSLVLLLFDPLKVPVFNLHSGPGAFLNNALWKFPENSFCFSKPLL